MAAPSSLIFHQSSAERWFYPYTANYAYYTLRSIFVQLFIEASDGHTAFMTPLHFDASFVMTSSALCNHHLTAPGAPLVLRPKPINLPPLAFEAQTGKPATSNVDACPTSRQVHQHEPFAWPSSHTIDRHVASYSCTSWAKRYIKYTQYCQSQHCSTFELIHYIFIKELTLWTMGDTILWIDLFISKHTLVQKGALVSTFSPGIVGPGTNLGISPGSNG